MITTAQEYYDNVEKLQNIRPPAYALLPVGQKVYAIDVNTRSVEVPEFVSVEKDHLAEVLYFSIDRFVDYMDLVNTSCMIVYNNAKKQTRTYAVPFYDIYTKAYENKIVFPWVLDGNVAEITGNIEFAIRFFKVGTKLNENNQPQPILEYSFNTLPVTSKVLKGIKEQQIISDDEFYLKPDQYQELLSKIDNLEKYHAATYWEIYEDSLVVPPIDEELQEDLKDVVDNLNQPNANPEEEAVG